ncbi:DUF2335 domain-containing protein [uncultured Muribaculum sp.]|uniref:DUF2335 domain-containing protein n=1 Tax=uncultured Muribaculum sp. TaxID=1918613 RepID=UPI0026707E8E|nr:DUF2335 domain-containing protein [uncultured Muribaculum sp.]
MNNQTTKPKAPAKKPESPSRSIESVVSAELDSVLAPLSDEQKQIVVRSIIAARSESFSGPLPHPELLIKYEEAFPGAAERIFKIAENEQGHRIKYDNDMLNGALVQAKRGQWMGFTLCILFGLLALAAAYLGYPILAGVLGGGTIISLAVVFVLNREPKREDRGKD